MSSNETISSLHHSYILSNIGHPDYDIHQTTRFPDFSTTKKVSAKYRDPISGKDWSGRGLAPKWISGKNKEDYLIK